MKKIQGASVEQFRWSRPGMLQPFELRAGDDLYGTLAFRSLFGTFATAASGDGTWTFKRVGFWQSRASIRQEGSEIDFAIFTNNTWSSGGTLQFATGERYDATTNFWQSRFDFLGPGGETCVEIQRDSILSKSATVRVLHAARHRPEVPILVLFGWYLTLMLDADDDGAGAVVLTAG